eukprot:3531963-Alexandrium_andersonii.AAC.1
MTSKGKESVHVCIQASGPGRAVQPRADVELRDQTTWELICFLDTHGWQHVAKEKQRSTVDPPYRPMDPASPRVWFSRIGSGSVP